MHGTSAGEGKCLPGCTAHFLLSVMGYPSPTSPKVLSCLFLEATQKSPLLLGELKDATTALKTARPLRQVAEHELWLSGHFRSCGHSHVFLQLTKYRWRKNYQYFSFQYYSIDITFDICLLILLLQKFNWEVLSTAQQLRFELLGDQK